MWFRVSTFVCRGRLSIWIRALHPWPSNHDVCLFNYYPVHKSRLRKKIMGRLYHLRSPEIPLISIIGPDLRCWAQSDAAAETDLRGHQRHRHEKTDKQRNKLDFNSCLGTICQIASHKLGLICHGFFTRLDWARGKTILDSDEYEKNCGTNRNRIPTISTIGVIQGLIKV